MTMNRIQAHIKIKEIIKELPSMQMRLKNLRKGSPEYLDLEKKIEEKKTDLTEAQLSQTKAA
jgi:hypothetical protein